MAGQLLLAEKEQFLKDLIISAKPLVVGFSGGVDSALLVQVAVDAIGNENVLAVTANSASLPRSEFKLCRELAHIKKWNWLEVQTHETDNPEYVKNDTNRCAHCKTSLFDALEPIATATNSKVALGIHLDDLYDYRPGQLVAKRRGGIFPLLDAGFNKKDIRDLAKKLDLPVWSKPAMACLASRIPTGTKVTIGRLKKVEMAEDVLNILEFEDFRVRYRGEVAQLELSFKDFQKLSGNKDTLFAIKSEFRKIGFVKVTVDISKFR
jgi:uncharacterized protein